MATLKQFSTLAIAFACSALSAPTFAQGSKVEVVRDGDGHRLLFNGEPYFINGAGGWQRLEELAASGGNSIRTWGAENAQQILDDAHKLGLTVTLGIWLGHERHGFNYDDPQQVQAQRDMVLSVIREHKDHPALLMWGLGNEVALTGEPRQVFPELEWLAREVKKIDPDHPVMAVIAGSSSDKMDAFMDICKSIDVLGVNEYGPGTAHVPEQLLEAGYDGPYAITEFGPRGWWQSPTTEWGAQIEQPSAEKAESYKAAYKQGVLESDRCVGSYVFLWGQKQEATPTWFGMFLDNGSKTQVVDVMHELWTGEPPADRCPVVRGIESEALGQPIKAGSEFSASVLASEPDGDSMTAHWVIGEESRDRRMGGDAEARAPEFPELTLTGGLEGATFKAPSKPGAYRLFVTVYDEQRNAGTANVPFLVVE